MPMLHIVRKEADTARPVTKRIGRKNPRPVPSSADTIKDWRKTRHLSETRGKLGQRSKKECFEIRRKGEKGRNHFLKHHA